MSTEKRKALLFHRHPNYLCKSLFTEVTTKNASDLGIQDIAILSEQFDIVPSLGRDMATK
jgi:hypothetical protein